MNRKLVAFLMLLAISLHGLVPIGYMPDFASRGWLMACDGTDHMAMPGAHAGHLGHEHCPHHNAPCPYSVGALFSFGGVQVPVLAPPVYDRVLELALPPDVRWTARSFGNASSRSPPSVS